MGLSLQPKQGGDAMTDLFELPTCTEPLLVTLAVRPEELELAFASEGESLRHRLMVAIIAELITLPPLALAKSV
jgi:hypothetical protein